MKKILFFLSFLSIFFSYSIAYSYACPEYYDPRATEPCDLTVGTNIFHGFRSCTAHSYYEPGNDEWGNPVECFKQVTVNINCGDCQLSSGGGGSTSSTTTTKPALLCTVGTNGETEGNCTVCITGGDDTCGTFPSTKSCTKTKTIDSRTNLPVGGCKEVTENPPCEIKDKTCVDPAKTCTGNQCLGPNQTPTPTLSITTTTLEANCSIIPSAVDFVLDRSGSMGDKQSGSTQSKLDYLKTAVKSFITKLPDSGIVGLQSFGEEANNDLGITLLQNNRNTINTKIDSLKANGGTPLRDALTMALSEIKKAQQNTTYKDFPYAIILFSDGQWNTGGDPTSVVNQIKALDVKIFTIAYGDITTECGERQNININCGLDFMKAAASSPSEYYYAPKDTDIQPILDAIRKKVCTTLTPIPTITPTPTPIMGTTTLSLTVGLDGIGVTGDNQNPEDKNCTEEQRKTQGCGSNQTPLNETRDILVEFYTTGNEPVSTSSGQILYASESGKFLGTVTLGNNFAGGSYVIKIKSPGYLKKAYPSIQAITAGTSNTLPSIRLVTGNVNQDSSLDIQDYNLLMSCSVLSSDSNGACNQKPNYIIRSDLEDNGTIDEIDYNLFMREWINQVEQ
jgi:uncharacterized protein YegL